MKCAIVLLCMGMLTLSALSEEEFHLFTSKDDRAISGRIVDFDGRKDTITIELENKRRASVPVGGFSDSDQQYIREWISAQRFMDKQMLRIDCDDKLVDESKDEERITVTYTSGTTVNDFLANVVHKERIAYEFEFDNRNTVPINGIRMEYRIYFEQSKMASGHNPEPEQHCFRGQLTVPSIEGASRKAVLTDAVEIYKDDINPIPQVGGDPRQGGKGEVQGIRARIYMKLSTGDEVMREFHHPSSLSERDFPWQ